MKKMKKKFFVLFMALVVAITTAPPISVFSSSTDLNNNVANTPKVEKTSTENTPTTLGTTTPKPTPKATRVRRDTTTAGIWINSDKSKNYATLKEALEKANAGDIINVQGDFSTNPEVAKNANANKAVTINITDNTVFKGDGSNGITLSNGAKIKTGSNQLTMSGFNAAISVSGNSAINDGNYVLDGNKIAFALNETGKIEGTSRSNLTISAKNSTGNGFSYNKDSRFIKCTIDVQVSSETGEQYSGLYMEDASLTTRGVWFYFNPENGAGGIHLDHSDLYVYKAKGSTSYRQVMAILGSSELKNGSSLTGDGSRITLADKLIVKDSKVVIKNSSDGGLNINYKPGEAVFENSALETTNMRSTPSYGTGQSHGPCYLTFKGNSVVNTDAKNRTSDNGGANRGTNSTYVVTGGSFLIAYDPTYNYDVTTPTNGADNGDEYLTLFTLKDSSINQLEPINKNGNTYTYSVATPSKDGKKHVWTPAAKVTFNLNNNDATFADGKTGEKSVKTIRGYKLDDVVGNVNPGNPADKNNVAFLGWHYKDDNGQEHSFNWNEKLTKDLEVYAKWDSKSVVYHNGDGKNYISSVEKDKSESKVLSFEEIVKNDATFSVPGKKFKYWTDDPAGNGKKYSANDVLKFSGNENIDLYAQYDQDEYKVSFSANGGTFASDSIFKTNTDVFTIESDGNGGEVAVLKKTAKYNNELRTLLNGLDYNTLKPDTNAKKPGYLLKDAESWATSSDGKGSARFDDHQLFGILTISGDNPKITKDTTYYLKWKEDPSVQKISQSFNIDGDIWSKSREDSKKTHIIYPEKEFSITGDLFVSEVKAQMTKIEDLFHKTERDFDKISLTDTKSTFTATLTIPDGIKIPENLNATTDGLGNVFEVVDTKVTGQKVVVTFKLKSGMTDYKKLKDAVSSLGTGSNSRISITLSGFKLTGQNVTDQQKLTAKGEVVGTFSSIAKDTDNNVVKNFSFDWTAVQSADGKDIEAQDNTTIQHTFVVSKPLNLILGGDLLVKKGSENFNTEHDAVYPADDDDSLTFNGRLDVSPIKRQIKDLKNAYDGDANKIITENVESRFVATLTFPEDMNLPETVTATLTQNGLFDIKKIEKDGNKVIVTMDLKKTYTKFMDLYNDVTSVPDTLDMEIPNVTLKTNVDGNKKLTAVGTVEGKFIGEATSESGKRRAFNYQWIAEQIDEGRDFIIKDETSNKTIQLTVQTPERVSFKEPLLGDLLVGDNTEHDKIHYVKPGEEFAYTGTLDVQPIKDKIDFLKNRYRGDANTISTKDIESTFTATLKIPAGITLPTTINAELTDNNLFKITESKKDGNSIIVKMNLKKNYTKFMDLYNDVQSVPSILKVTFGKVTVDRNLHNGQSLAAVGTVEGVFKGKAYTASGKTEKYNFTWIAEQDPKGLDFFLRNASNDEKKKIQYTIVVVKPLDLILEGDILIGSETEHDAIFKAKQGQSLTYTGRLDVTPIKNQIDALKAQYGGNPNTIKVNDVASTFKAVLDFDSGLDIPNNPKLTLTNNDLFEIVKVEKVGQKVTVTMTLKKNYTKFMDLYNDVTGVSDYLDLDIENVTVNKNVKVGQRLKVVGDVTGIFTGEAISEEGTHRRFDFNWTTEQTEAGKDFVLRNQPNNKTIQFTLEVVDSKTPGTNPDPKPNDKPNNPKEKPSTKPEVKKPKTGDESNLSVYAGLLGASLMAFAVFTRKKITKKSK